MKKFPPRVRFNWGYHDAVAEFGRKRPRKLTLRGTQSLQVVSRSYDIFYFEGYRKGLEHFAELRNLETSDLAWKEFQAEKKAKKEEKKNTLEVARREWGSFSKRF